MIRLFPESDSITEAELRREERGDLVQIQLAYREKSDGVPCRPRHVWRGGYFSVCDVR